MPGFNRLMPVRVLMIWTIQYDPTTTKSPTTADTIVFLACSICFVSPLPAPRITANPPKIKSTKLMTPARTKALKTTVDRSSPKELTDDGRMFSNLTGAAKIRSMDVVYTGVVKIAIEKELQQFFATKRNEAEHVDASLTSLVDAIAEFTLRPAKRLRPHLVQLAFSSFHSQPITNNQQLISAMLAVELFHTFVLIHDDIMDQDETRRGGPTMHKMLGTNMAILAGDLVLVWADECISKVQSRKSKVESIYQHMKEEVMYGQVLDIAKHKDQDKINELKTAWYSVVRPLQIGAALAGATEQTLSALADYGVPVGKLFQLKDDLMDKEISQDDFNKKIIPLQKQVDRALGAFSDAGQLSEFAGFVLERTS